MVLARKSVLESHRLNTGYVVSSRDISARLEAEKKQADTESRLKEIANTTADVLWMFSGDWSEVLFVNPAYKQLYGTSTADLESDPSIFLDSVHPDDRAHVEAAMETLSEGTPVDIEYRLGSDRDFDQWVWVQAEPIQKDGDVIRIVGFSRDITERRRRERQLAVMDNLLRHNLRNDLNVIVSALDTIDRETDNPDVTEQTRVIRRVGSELLTTAEKQRDTIDVLTAPTEHSTIDLATSIRGSINRVREEHPSVIVDVELPEPFLVHGLPDLELAIAELIDNAIAHADCAPQIHITGRASDSRRTVTIEDNCPPIPETEYRVLTGEREMNALYHTSGLGLWLVYWVVTLSDGHISFSEQSPRGNAISISLPAAGSS